MELQKPNPQELITELVKQLESNQKTINLCLVQIREMTPKAELCDKFISAKNSQPIATVGNLFGIGEKTFFKMLREAGILIPDGTRKNLPYERYMKYFEVKDIPVRMGDKIVNVPTTYVRPIGIDFLAKKFNLIRETEIDGQLAIAAN
jgi:phage antirepressor YoqD-like protein